MAATVEVRGLNELNRTFRQLPADLRREARKDLRSVGEPVKQRAEELAISEISHIGPKWSRMRLAYSAREAALYMAPRQRGGRGRSRPNLAGLLMDKAMEPALEQNTERVMVLMEAMLGRVARRFEIGG